MNYCTALGCVGSQHQSAFHIRCNSFARFLFVILSLLAAQMLPAAEQTSVDATTEGADELKALRDQTIIQSRVWLDTEWDRQVKHSGEEATWTLGGLWGWRVSDGQDWAVRLKLPFVYDRSDKPSGRTDIGGLGDIEVSTGTAFRLSNTWRTGGGIELHADTAANPALGDSVWRLHPYWSVAHDFTNWLTLIPTADYNHSIAEDHNVAPQRYLELSLPATFILPYGWSIGTNYKAKIDFENGDRWTHTINLGVAKRLSNIPLVLSAILEKQLNRGNEQIGGGNKKFQANLTMTYYFERPHLPK